ncbi:MAG: hypothetical protein LM601_10750 [Candidatus Verstraetearchaeota archaeon]|nr:hypothetical protein [Candidatus Verstraetearchaeota archaeon]
MSGKSRRVILKIVIRGKTYTFDLSYLGENWGCTIHNHIHDHTNDMRISTGMWKWVCSLHIILK